MNQEIGDKLQKIALALDEFEEGKPLPISVADIHYVIGACNGLINTVNRLEKHIATEMTKQTEELEKYKDKYRESRSIAVRLDNKAMKYQQVIDTVRRLSWWRMSKDLQKELDSLDSMIVQNKF